MFYEMGIIKMLILSANKFRLREIKYRVLVSTASKGWVFDPDSLIIEPM